MAEREGKKDRQAETYWQIDRDTDRERYNGRQTEGRKRKIPEALLS